MSNPCSMCDPDGNPCDRCKIMRDEPECDIPEESGEEIDWACDTRDEERYEDNDPHGELQEEFCN